MKTNKAQRSVKIISEIHPQFMGSKSELKRMIIQSKLSGADYIKVQLYSSQKLFGNKNREYIEINFNELKELKKFSDDLDIKIFASIFDEEKIEWCERLDFEFSFPSNSRVIIRILDLNGRFITSLVDHYYSESGTVTRTVDKADWDGKNHLSQIVSPGTYLMHMEVTNYLTGKSSFDIAPIVVGVNH